MFKYICLIGLFASVYGFPSQPQPQPQDEHSKTTTILVPSTNKIISKSDAVPSFNPIEHTKPEVESINQPAGRPQYAGAPVPFRIAGPPTNDQRPIIVLHKPPSPPKASDDQETLDNAASEWWSNRWQNNWWRNDNNQFDGYNPYNSYGYNNGWAQPQYNYYSYWY